jgi:27-O-demethylrifamycin SV methyltransferase
MPSDDAGRHNRQHYDSVTDAWAFILGDNLHYGLFSANEDDLASATDRLIREMAEFGELREGSRVLDVGCGTGNPAFVLCQEFGCDVTGITISGRGVEIASREAGERGLSGQARFLEVDALDNRLDAGTFDLVWQMESSHLMHDKARMFQENCRVLKPNGCIVLCDLFLKREFSVADIYEYREQLAVLETSFGKAKMAPMDSYREVMLANGFEAVKMLDVSQRARPTLARWKENVEDNRVKIEQYLDNAQVVSFLSACDILDDFFRRDLLGYGLIKARRH